MQAIRPAAGFRCGIFKLVCSYVPSLTQHLSIDLDPQSSHPWPP